MSLKTIAPHLMKPAHFKNLLKGIFLLISMNAYSGGQTSVGGGDAIICSEKKPYSGWFAPRTLSRYYLADTYDYLKGASTQQFILLAGASDLRVYQMLIQELNRKQPGAGDYINSVVNTLDFRFENKELVELEDDNIKVPAHCYKKQLAIQELSKNKINIVHVNKNLHDNLSPLERQLLKIHEAYIRIKGGPRDTTEIRKLVKSVMSDKKALFKAIRLATYQDLPQKDFYQYILALGIMRTYSYQAGFGVESILNQDETRYETVEGLAKRIKESSAKDNEWYHNMTNPYSSASRGNYADGFLILRRYFQQMLIQYFQESGRCKKHIIRSQAELLSYFDDALIDAETLSESAKNIGDLYCKL